MTGTKTYYRRSGRKISRKHGGVSRKGPHYAPRLDPKLKQIFKQIGVPEAVPFQPDPFQTEALERIGDSDVLVSAPTGSGKTWIASQTISGYLERGLSTWYASPLKALSNSIYRQFCQEFGNELCGILTGDRKENPDAPIIVGTTEILRNQLYDAMHEGRDIATDLVILDEAHYLSDPERGVVWEEVLIYLPPRVKLLLLSATISNAEEIGEWLEMNRKTRTRIVRSDERPVPLEMLFLFPDGMISPLGGRKGLVPAVKKFVASQQGRGRRRGSPKVHYGDIIHCLRTFDLLPAIFFLKSRMDCDRALSTCGPSVRPDKDRERMRREVRSFLQKYPHLEDHRQMKSLLKSAVGSHHAGQLPYWKILVETLMKRGRLDAIFSTSTVAAGVNFPARTVVLVQSDRFNGREFADLTATDFHQMTGRAGRRGMDNIGFALVIPGIHQDLQLLYELKDSPSEPLLSQIHINFSMTLNLLLSHSPEEVKVLLERSFAAFQEKKSGTHVRQRWKELIDTLKGWLPGARCNADDPFEIMEYIQKRAEWQREARRLSKELRGRKILNEYRKYLTRGRLFLHKNRNVYVVFDTYMDKDRFICLAQNIRKTIGIRKKKIRLKKVAFTQVRALLDRTVELPVEASPERLQSILDQIDMDMLEFLEPEIPEEKQGSEDLDLQQKRLRDLPCSECDHFRVCHSGKDKVFTKLLRDFRSLAETMEGMEEGLWFSFKRHLRFLKDTGFVDEENHLTSDGIWASKLRLDQPLLIAEAIRRGAFDGSSPEILAGCIAPFVWDRTQDLDVALESPFDLKELEKSYEGVLQGIEEISRMKTARGFDNPTPLYWPAAALYLWTRGVPWEKILSFLPVDDGDMASLIMRTADHLRQVADLRESHPELAERAESAVALIMREPVFID